MLALDHEVEPLYVRRTTYECLNINPDYRDLTGKRRTDHDGVVQFCGQYYSFVCLYYCEVSNTIYYGESTNNQTYHFYTLESLNRFYYANKHRKWKPLEKDNYAGTKARTFDEYCDELQRQMFDWRNTPKAVLDKILHNRKCSPNEILSIGFNNKDCPIAVRIGRNVTYDARLANVQFAKVKPPQEAYVELYQWLSNKAVPTKSIPTIDDKTMAEIKGFDKWSFRKEPTKS